MFQLKLSRSWLVGSVQLSKSMTKFDWYVLWNIISWVPSSDVGVSSGGGSCGYWGVLEDVGFGFQDGYWDFGIIEHFNFILPVCIFDLFWTLL